MFDFVLGDYNKEHWYWEIVEFGRKLLLSGLMGLVGRGSIAQAVVCTVIAFFFFAFSLSERPYQSKTLNTIKIVSEFQIFLILLTCVVLQTNRGSLDEEHITVDGYGLIQILATLCIVPFVLFMIVRQMRALEHMVEDVIEEVIDHSVDESGAAIFEVEGGLGKSDVADREGETFEFENPVMEETADASAE
jgi:hypothetical protein